MTAKKVDSYKFTSGITRRTLKTWANMETPRKIPWTPLDKPLQECRVALISSGGIALKTDTPFDQEGERQNPWWGDPSYRIIPQTKQSDDIRVCQLHIDPSLSEMFKSSKIVIDATRQLPSEGGPETFPYDLRTAFEERVPEAFEIVDKKWDEYFSKK